MRLMLAIIALGLLCLLLAPFRDHEQEPVEVSTRPSTTTTALSDDAVPALPDSFGELVRASKVARSGPKRSEQNKRAATGAVPDIIRRVFARFGPVVAEQAVRVAKCESGFDPNARLGPNVGVFQLNGQFHQARAARLGFSWSRVAVEAEPNVLVAADLYADSGWRPWSCRWAA